MKIFTEASGSLTSAYLINAIRECACISVGSDVSTFNHGSRMCDYFVVMPRATDPKIWDKTINILTDLEVNMVIPSLDETLLGWAERTDLFLELGINIIISPVETIRVFQDKWETYKFFKSINIATPKTSLKKEYELIKPRLGRGGAGIFKKNSKKDFSMEGYISQEVIKGVEYTVDVLFSKSGKPIYIIPRVRLDVKDGKSTKGVVVNNPKIDSLIVDISKNIKFIGPINFQLFETKDNELILIEVNPRIAGGMALGFAATENWIKIIVDNIIDGKEVTPKDINYGLKMVRYYNECFI